MRNTILTILFFLALTVSVYAQSNTCNNGDALVINTSGSKNNQCIPLNQQPAGTGSTMLIANDTVTGTTLNKFAKLSGAPSKAIISSNGDTENAIGVVTSGAGTTGTATITIMGQVSCVFDGATTANDYVTIAATGGGCHSAGATYPTGTTVYGKVLSTNGGAGTYVMELMTPDITGSAATSGNGKNKAAGSVGDVQVNVSGNNFGAVSPGTSGNVLTSNGSVWQSVAPAGGSIAPLVIESANAVSQRNSTNAQTFNVYNSYGSGGTDTNFLSLTSIAGPAMVIKTNKTGAASDPSLRITVQGSSYDWTGGNFFPATNGSQSLGLSSNRWSDVRGVNISAQTSLRFEDGTQITPVASSLGGVVKFSTTLGSDGTFAGGNTTPATLGADQNNYDPGGLSYFQRWSSNASRNVTGLVKNLADGQVWLIVNVGANPIVLQNENASSTAANRFHTSTGADVTLNANQAADAIYDSTLQRWWIFKRN